MIRTLPELTAAIAKHDEALEKMGPRGPFKDGENSLRKRLEENVLMLLTELRDRFGRVDCWLSKGRPVLKFEPNADLLETRLTLSTITPMGSTGGGDKGGPVPPVHVATTLPDGTGKGIIIITKN